MNLKWSNLQGILAGIGFLILIFDSSLAVKGAKTGIELCIKTVIPALFPFFVLSILLTAALEGRTSYPIQIFAKILHISDRAAPVLIPAVLGGYPVGAKCIGDLFHGSQISKNEAERLIAFCSNAGPSFLFGMVSGFFPGKKYIWLLWFIHLFSAVLTALVIPGNIVQLKDRQSQKSARETSIIFSAAKAMCLVCCWVILFRMMIAFLDSWFLWMLPKWGQVLLMGVLELTNGCCALPMIADVDFRLVLCSCILAFGGICVVFQTASVTKGLSIGCYVKGKLIQTAFSFVLSCAAIAEHWLILPGISVILWTVLRKKQKSYSNPAVFPV